MRLEKYADSGTGQDPEIVELKHRYEDRRADIEQRLRDFERVFEEDDERVFAELAFCLCTPQTQARRAWRAVEKMIEKGVLYDGDADDIKAWMAGVRFYNNKSRWIKKAQTSFKENGTFRIKDRLRRLRGTKEMREWLIENVKGFGYKEASHFLRNIGFCEDIAILDRHILRNMKRYGVIDEVPKSMTPKRYLEIEDKLRQFSEKTGIPMSHLDLLFWSEETGEIFK